MTSITKFDLRYIEFLIVLVLLLIFGSATYQRNLAWEDELTLWADVVEKSPRKARGYNEMGMYYYERKMLDQAIPYFMTGISLYPDYGKAHNNLGLSFMGKGLIDQSIMEFKKAVSLNPDNGMYHINLGIAYLQKGFRDLAYKEIQTGKSLRKKHEPNRPSPHD
jgi:tetratricopeptide (TPR) repeat protein